MSFDPARFWIDPQAEKQLHPLPAVSHLLGGERVIMDEKFWQQMRDNEFMLVDAPARKIAVFPNTSGQIILAVNEDDGQCVASLCADEFNSFLKLFNDARLIADEKDAEIGATYAIHCAKVEK